MARSLGMPSPRVRDALARLRAAGLLAHAVAVACGGAPPPDDATQTGAGSSSSTTAASTAASDDGTSGESTTGDASDGPASSTGAGACADAIVWPGDLHLASELDNPELPCVTEVEGTVWIEAVPGITDLAALASVTRIGGGLGIGDNEALTSLHGLEALQHVDVVGVSGNPVLADVRGLAGVRTLGGWSLGWDQPGIVSVEAFAGDLELTARTDGVADFTLASMPHVVDLSGLLSMGALSVVGEGRYRVQVADLPGLDDASGLSVFAQLGDRLSLTIGSLPLATFAFGGEPRVGALTLAYYPALQRVELPGVESIGELSFYDGLPQLASLEGLEGLEHIDRLWLGSCGAATDFGLTSLAGIEGVTSVDALVIVGTPSLDSIDALAEGTAIGTVTIADNVALPTADVLARLELLEIGGTVTVCGNQGGQACPREIEPCMSPPVPG